MTSVHDIAGRLAEAEAKVTAARQLGLDGRPDSFMEAVRATLRNEAGIPNANLATSLVMRDLREHLGRALHTHIDMLPACPACGHLVGDHWPNNQGRSTTACVVCLDGNIITGPEDRRGICCMPAHRIIHEVA